MRKARVLPLPVSQNELDFIDGLTCRIEELRKLRCVHCRTVMDRLMDGREVEPGRHTADLDISDIGLGRTYRLVIDGRVIR